VSVALTASCHRPAGGCAEREGAGTFSQGDPPRNGHGYARGVSFWNFLDFFWSMDARGGLNATKE